MEQGRGGGGDQMKLQQDQRGLSRTQLQNQQHPPPQQPQKCPRCESLNTKFCYYNNYSLSQPRYFCKTCRRYWTQGGTLRNVPVGGGCRKGKRTRESSSPENLINSSSGKSALIAPPLRSKGLDLPIAPPSHPPSMYYPGSGGGGGFLSSLASYQSFNQPLHVGGEFGLGGSNLALLQGFSHLPFHTQQLHQHHQQEQEPNLYLHQSHDLNLEIEEKVAPNMPSGSHQDWSQSFNNSSSIPPITTEAADYWNTNNNTGCTSTNTQPTTHWTDHLSGYGGPQQQQQHQQPPPSSTTTASSSPPPSFL